MFMSGKYYGYEFREDDMEELEELNEIVLNGEPVLLCNSLDDLEEFGIDIDNVVMVE